MVFIGDRFTYKMAAIDTLTPKPGTLSAKVFASDARFFDAALDSTRDELYVAASTQVDVYANASKLDGAIKASRTFTPAISGLIFVQRVFLDKANDRLYLGVKAAFNGSVAVFEQASKLSGTVAPSRIISGPILGDNFTLDLKRNLLYTTWNDSSPAVIYVFDHIDTAKGETAITRRINIPGGVTNLAVDSSRNRLYMASGGGVTILDGASTAVGNPVVTSLSLPSKNYTTAITIDALNDRLYVGLREQAFVLNDASKLNASGAAQAVATSGPADTSILFFAVPQ